MDTDPRNRPPPIAHTDADPEMMPMPGSLLGIWQETPDCLLQQLSAHPPTPHQVTAMVRAQEAMSRYVRELDDRARLLYVAAWVDELLGIPMPFVHRAFRGWREVDMPAPWQIAGAAHGLMRQAKDRLDEDAPADMPEPRALPTPEEAAEITRMMDEVFPGRKRGASR